MMRSVLIGGVVLIIAVLIGSMSGWAVGIAALIIGLVVVLFFGD